VRARRAPALHCFPLGTREPFHCFPLGTRPFIAFLWALASACRLATIGLASSLRRLHVRRRLLPPWRTSSHAPRTTLLGRHLVTRSSYYAPRTPLSPLPPFETAVDTCYSCPLSLVAFPCSPAGGKPVLLFLDGHASRWSLAALLKLRENNVFVFCVPSHSTIWSQPNDAGCNASFQVGTACPTLGPCLSQDPAHVLRSRAYNCSSTIQFTCTGVIEEGG
jgi:hypothetical protein